MLPTWTQALIPSVSASNSNSICCGVGSCGFDGCVWCRAEGERCDGASGWCACQEPRPRVPPVQQPLRHATHRVQVSAHTPRHVDPSPEPSPPSLHELHFALAEPLHSAHLSCRSYLTNPADLESLRKGLGIARSILAQEPFAHLLGPEVFPGASSHRALEATHRAPRPTRQTLAMISCRLCVWLLSGLVCRCPSPPIR